MSSVLYRFCLLYTSFIRRCSNEYDLIIVDSNDPFGPSEGYFTREFYGICYNALREDGIMVNQQGSPFYKHDAEAMQRSHKRIVNTFPISRVYQAHICLLYTSIDDIQNIYLPMGFSNFKIEGRGLGSALILEFLLYYMTKPEYQIHVREAVYLDNMLDLF